MNRFGEKLRTLRKKHDYSLQKLGDVLQVHHTFVSQLELGKKLPSGLMILKIADIFGVSTDALMRDELEI
jgi:transcriptional regulator with XRE-family HTH domain